MPKGRESIDSKLRKLLDKGLFDLIRVHCHDCKTKEEAAEILTFLTDGEIKIIPGSLYTILKKAQAAGTISEEDDFFLSWVNEKKRRGKKSISMILKERLGKDLWTLIREQCSGCKTTLEASKVLTGLTNGDVEVKPASLHTIIKKALEVGTVSSKGFYASWVASKRKKKKHSTLIESESAKEGVRIPAVCQNCGEHRDFDIDKATFLSMGIAIRGSSCRGCGLWSTFEYSIEIDGKEYSGKDENWKDANPNWKE